MFESGFYNMDCMEGMKEFPDGFFDLAIVDPPYGMNITGRHVVKDADGGALSTGSPDRSAAIRVRGGEITRSAVCGSYGRGRPPISRGGVR